MARDPGRIGGPVVIPNTVQVRLIWTLPNGRTVFNVLHATVPGGFAATGAIAEQVFTLIKGAAGWASLRARLNAGVAFAGVDIRDLRVANMPLVASTSAASAGTAVGVALPPGDALVVTLRTAGAGRSFRGRMFLPGFDSTSVAAGGVASAGTVADATAFATDVQTALTNQGMTLAIGQPARQTYVSANGTNHPARGASAAVVTSITTRNNIFDHQRRRAGRS